MCKIVLLLMVLVPLSFQTKYELYLVFELGNFNE